MEMAATFIMKLVIIMRKKAIPMINTNQVDSLNITSQFTAIHLAAPVSHRQKPILMAPANRRMIFQGISSRSSRSRMPVMKKRIVEIKIMAVLSIG